MGWTASKIILRLISLGYSLSADPTSWIYFKGNAPDVSQNRRTGIWKSGGSEHKSYNISETAIFPAHAQLILFTIDDKKRVSSDATRTRCMGHV